MPEPGTRRAFETSDISLASFLRCRGFPFEDLKRSGNRTLFVFRHSDELHRAVLAYANDESVPVRSFSNNLRDLKALTR
ncbi:MAG: hypothetical protein HYU51_09995 [Candidatus Rokubacteria bacterium]|nr:hypothetical protein [Candidatus Rokubacteria bacterium]